MSVAVEVIDMTMDDSEIEVQNDMFGRIMDICGGNPSRRVLQVLVDTLTCTAVATGESLDELLEAVKLSFKDALPKDSEN
jgi:mannose/fructose-specific phosphotransferase system component IIA